jgi:hypothetical protein
VTDHLEQAAGEAVVLAAQLIEQAGFPETGIPERAAAHLTYMAGLIRGGAAAEPHVKHLGAGTSFSKAGEQAENVRAEVRQFDDARLKVSRTKLAEWGPVPIELDQARRELDVLREVAAEVVKYWTDWTATRRQGVRDLSSYLGTALDDLTAHLRSAARKGETPPPSDA